MPLAPRKVEIPLFGGLQQDVSPEVMAPPSMTLMTNIRYDKEGRARRRWGYTELSDTVAPIPGGGNLPAVARLASRDQHELLAFGETRLYSRANDRWKNMDRVPGFAGLERLVVANQYVSGDISNASCAYTDDYIAVCWEVVTASAHTIQVLVLGRLHRQVISSAAFTNGVHPHIVASGTGSCFILVYADTTGANLKASRYDLPILGSWSASSNIVTNLEAASSSNFDVAGGVGEDAFYVANTRTAAGRQLDVRRFNATTLAITHSGLDVRPGKACTKPSIIPLGSTLFVAYYIDTDSHVEILGRTIPDVSVSAFGASTVGTPDNPPTHVTIGLRNTGVYVAWDNEQVGTVPPTAVQHFEWRGVSTGGAVEANGPWRAQNLRLASRPFLLGDGRTYVAASTRTNQVDQYGLLLVDIGDSNNAWNTNSANVNSYRGRPVAKWMTADYHTSVNTTVLTDSPLGAEVVNEVGVVTHTELYMAFPKRDLVASDISRGTAVELTVLRRGNLEAWNGTCQVGRDLFIPAAMPYCYDGELAFECDYSWYPWVETIQVTAGGSLLVDNVYSYKVVYEWIDRQGRIWQSHPSTTEPLDPDAVGGGNNPVVQADGVVQAASRAMPTAGQQTIALRVPNCSMTAKVDHESQLHPIAVVFYRKNETIPDPTWIRLAALNFPESDPTAGTYLTFTDNGTLSTVGQPNIYSNEEAGSALPNFAPRPSNYACIFDNRVFQVCSDNPRRLQFSFELLIDEGVRFHEAFFIDTPDDGNIVAIAPMGPYLIIFKNRSIYWLQGQGPDNTGENFAYTPPVKTPTDRGCISNGSVAVTPMGVFFQSERGIDLLTSSLSLEFKGGAVEDILDGNRLITSASVHLQDSEVRFTIVSTGGGEEPDDGGILKYNYEFDRWSRDIVFSGLTAPSTGVYHDGLYHWADLSAHVVQEVRTDAANTYCDQEYLSTTREVPYTIESPEIKLDGLQGFQRIWRVTLLGRALYEDPIDSPGVQVLLWYDGDNNVNSYDFTSAEIVDQGNAPIIQLRLIPQIQRLSSMRIRVSETLPPVSSTDRHNAGIAWTAAMLEYGIEPKPLGRFKGSANK